MFQTMTELNEKDSSYHKLLALENVLSTLKWQKKIKKSILVKENSLHLFSLYIVQPVAQITKLLPVLTDVCVVFIFNLTF